MTADPRPRILPQAVLDAMPGAVAQLSEVGDILGVNAAWRTLAERLELAPSTNVTVGANYLDACDRAAAAGVAWVQDAATTVRRVLAGDAETASIEYELATPTSRCWFELVAARLDGDGFRGALVTQADITARKLAAEALLRSEAQYRAIVESAPVGIYQTTPDGRVLAANQALADIVAASSRDDLIGSNIARLYANSGEREALIGQHRPETAGTPIELEWRRLDGAPIWVQLAARAIADAAGRTVYWEGFVYDISERKRLESQLSQAQKMESVGRLAGGIAHDFNNLLTVMIGYAELLHTSDDLPVTFRDAVGEILGAARRAAELTGRMLAFARKQRVQPQAVNVNDVVRGVEGLLRRIIGEDVRLEVRLASELPSVLIDPAQLEQVLMNLAVNARDAMPRGGTLTIASDAVVITEEEARRRPGMRPGRQVRLSVADTGVGMEPETLARAFEPFFTTKDPGKGTGLGLAMCYGIIKQASGFIGCDSSPHIGTTCTVLLPAAAGVPVSPQMSGPVPAGEPRPSTPRATILIVEDEPVVRRFVADILIASGYVVHATGSPKEGIDIATAQHPVDLLVTDIVMPQMDGVTLAARIRAHQPNLRVLLMSGYQERPIAADTASLLLPKPFTAAQLRARVAQALQGNSKT
jgi:two-component system, cell cycle sensor histidine kinase and response regulator CckA